MRQETQRSLKARLCEIEAVLRDAGLPQRQMEAAAQALAEIRDSLKPRATRTGARPKETRELFERVFSNIHLLVAYLDPDFNFIRVNRAYAEVDGRAQGFFVGRNHFDLYPNEENEAIFRRVVETGEPFMACQKAFTYPNRPERGVTYWDWTLDPVKDADGRVTALVFTLRDVTQQKRAEEALKESERKYRTLMEQASDGIVMFDREGRILEANSKAGDMLGYECGELIGLDVRDLIAQEDLARSPLRIGQMVEGKTLVDEHAWKRRDGRLVTVEATGKMLNDGRLQVMMRDVSRRKRVEEEIRAYQQRLRLMTSQLALAEEKERRRIAKDIHDHVGQTLALCQIKLGALQEQAGESETGEALREIRNYIYWVIVYTRSLTFELGSPILYELGLEAAIQEAIEQMQSQYGVTAAFDDDGSPKPLSGDLRMVLYRAVRELLMNVVKHARAESVSVVMRAEDRSLVIRVRDDGAGFDPGEIGSHVSRSGGFGLFSIRERLDYLGGSLDVESAPGRGTTVTLRAPLIKNRP